MTGIAVHWARTVPASALSDRLTAADAARVARIRQQTVRDSVASSLVLARTVVETVAGTAAVDLVRRCPRCGSREHGRPLAVWGAVPDDVRWTAAPHLSLARSSTVVVVATSRVGHVGVDVERRSGRLFAGFDDVALAPAEVALHAPGDAPARLRTWVRKEAVLKAAGRGLTVDPRTLVLGAPDEPPRIVSAPAGLEVGHLGDVDVVPGHLIAVATRFGGERPTVEVSQLRL